MFSFSKVLPRKRSLTRVLLYLILHAFALDVCLVKAEDHGAKKPSGPGLITSPISSKPRKKRIKKVDPSKSEFEEPKALTGEKDLSDKDAPVLDEAIETVIVLDNSRSMNKTDPNRIRDQGAKLFLQFLEPSDFFSIVQFADEAKVVIPFIQLSKTTPEEISEALRGVSNDGNFTDFLSGIELAQNLFDESRNPKTMGKALIILTDGQNDPNPTKHSSKQVRDEILRNRIPILKKKGIRVFTLALSELADRAFLAEISKESNGLSWYADDVNEVHRVFSDLFLSLKKPQVLELTDDGFEIDSSSQEATFFVSRSNESDSVSVVDPSFREFTNKGFPSNWKWFRGPLFDVITVPNPLPGRWMIKGGKDGSGDISGFAKLLTNLSLEHDWPEGTLEVGDTAILKVRLNGDPVILGDPQLKDLLFYSYKIINLKTGTVYLQGKLTDNGQDGDKTAGDNVFASKITLNEEGEFKMFVSVIGPTFSRQLHIPVSVTRGLISLDHLKANNFNIKKDQYFVKLYGEAKEFKNRKVSLVAEIVGKPGSSYGLKLTHQRHDEPIYDIDLGKLQSGQNKVYAIVSGTNSHGKEERAKSEEINIDVENHGEGKNNYENLADHGTSDSSSSEDSGHDVSGGSHNTSADHGNNINEEGEGSGHGSSQHEGETDVEGGDGDTNVDEDSVPVNKDWLFGFIGVLINIIIAFFVARIFIKKSKQEDGVSVEIRPVYEMDGELSSKIELIKSTASTTKQRAVNPEEIALFALLPEVSNVLTSISDGINSEHQSEAKSSEVEESGDSSENTDNDENRPSDEATTGNDSPVDADEEPKEEVKEEIAEDSAEEQTSEVEESSEEESSSEETAVDEKPE